MIRDFQNIDDDIIYKKRIIKEILYNDSDIIELLDNPKLDPNSPDEYLGINIFLQFILNQYNLKFRISFVSTLMM